MWNFLATILEKLESTGRFFHEFMKKKSVWSFTKGVRIIFRERRCPQENETDQLKAQCQVNSKGIMIVPAVKYSSLGDLCRLTEYATAGDSTVIGAAANSICNMNESFLRYVNSKAKEGHNLYFDVYYDKREIND